MNLAQKIERIEGDLRTGNVSIDQLCEKAGIARSTWQRWKSGAMSPTFARWDQIEVARNSLCRASQDTA